MPPIAVPSAPLWPDAGLTFLQAGEPGLLRPTAAYWQHWLSRPELALVGESCRAERALHDLLGRAPLSDVPPAMLAAVRDADVRQNWGHWLALRDAVQAAGSLQAWYLQLMRSGSVQVPPLFIDIAVQAMVQQLLGEPAAPLQARTAELFFRTQHLAFEQGRMLAADADTVAEQAQTQGLGTLGRLLAQAQVQASPLALPVLGAGHPEADARYSAEAARAPFRSSLLLDLGAAMPTLCTLLERWARHLLGVVVHIEAVPRIADERWRWHLGLDAEASRLLNDLYHGEPVAEDRRARIVGLFRLRFANSAEMERAVRGHPVWMALMATPDGRLRMKPQNLLLNLPLAAAS